MEIEAILITHCHFDHIGAVAEVARATGAPVYCPEIERPVLADINSWVPPGFGPFESYEAEQTVTGGERLSWRGWTSRCSSRRATARDTSPTRSPAASDGKDDSRALLSGDVLFQGSVGRVDLPGGDWNVLERSIGGLLRTFPGETIVYPGHMGVTTLGASATRTRSCRSCASPVSSPPAADLRRTPRQPKVEPRGEDQSAAGHVRRARRAGGGARDARGARAGDPGGGRV